jgi:hypothetical protein
MTWLPVSLLSDVPALGTVPYIISLLELISFSVPFDLGPESSLRKDLEIFPPSPFSSFVLDPFLTPWKGFLKKI